MVQTLQSNTAPLDGAVEWMVAETPCVCKAVESRIQTRPYTSVATQDYQLWHYSVIVPKLAILCCNRHVGLRLNLAYKSHAYTWGFLLPSTLSIHPMGLCLITMIGPHVTTSRWGSAGGWSVHCTFPYALIHWTCVIQFCWNTWLPATLHIHVCTYPLNLCHTLLLKHVTTSYGTTMF